MGADDLVGVWQLVSYVELDESGGTREGPLGPAPEGLLMYRADGHMSVSMMRSLGEAGRAPQGWPALPDGQEAFMGYAGRWRLAGDTVLHDVHVSAHPHQVGTEQVRQFELDGDLLTLYGTRPNGDRPQRRMLRWRRVPTPAAALAVTATTPRDDHRGSPRSDAT